ncbi:hypothetical protein PR202_ga00669 [Eleusine coracana subsp. coracana]|uniref:F-box domain-containing protein n=1 Tax=Eleusine coracana subsp. coracana TaxID=191504 RepID=A0AAV5BGF0_ELECO|nr:hypothetical protein QOZ80_2AG0130100 [Eleusine coracana subsp. coracana]GJM84952.1 hypothetical protein PR202_ga00669 [Eleusine coracana subsp. coracana]
MEDVADMLVYGPEFRAMDENMQWLTLDVIKALPRPTVSTAAPLASAAAARAPADFIDRISRLPGELLRNIVSRLPAKDAARTTALAKRWRRVWHSVPFVLVDAHLLSGTGVLGRDRSPYRGTGMEAMVSGLFRMVDGPFHLTDTVSHVLAAHPGPFGFVYLIGTNMETLQDRAARWLPLLAAKGLKELVFVNLAMKLEDKVRLPTDLFKCTSLTKLYIGSWWLPDTADLPRTAAFPYLRELGLCNLIMNHKDLIFLLDRCPVLEKLLITRSRLPVCIRIQSRSLRSVQVSVAAVPEITVVNAPRLERLLLWEAWGWGDRDLTNMSCKVKIGHTPKLRILGFLVPGMHQLEIGNRVIKSENDDLKFRGPQDKVNIKFWKEAGPIECVQKHIKKLVLRGFRGRKRELDFLKFVAEHAQVLQEVVIEMTYGYLPSDNLGVKLRIFMASAKWANECCKMMAVKCPFDQEATAWCYPRGFDFSIEDPFDVSKCQEDKCGAH